MIGPLGGPELLILFIFFAPFGILAWVATNRGRSLAWALLGFLAWLGLIIGLVILLSAPSQKVRPPKTTGTPGIF